MIPENRDSFFFLKYAVLSQCMNWCLFSTSPCCSIKASSRNMIALIIYNIFYICSSSCTRYIKSECWELGYKLFNTLAREKYHSAYLTDGEIRSWRIQELYSGDINCSVSHTFHKLSEWGIWSSKISVLTSRRTWLEFRWSGHIPDHFLKVLRGTWDTVWWDVRF